MKKSTILLIALLVLTLKGVKAQEVSLSNIKAMYLRNVEAIVENDEVKGYTAFYMVEKKNSKENNYKLVIYDNNLNEKYNIDLTKTKYNYMMESAYSGDAFCYSFIDLKTKSISYMVYDKLGQLAGTDKVLKISRTELVALQQKTQKESQEFYGGLIAVPGKGFVHYNLDAEKGKSAVLTMIDNKGAKIWNYTQKGSDNSDYVTAFPVAANSEYIVSQVYTRENMMTQTIKTWFLSFVDPESGKEIFSLDCKNGKNQWSVNGVTFEGGDIYVYGEYFKPGVSFTKGDSEGLFLLKLDNKGSVLSESYSDWDSDITKVLPGAMKDDKGKRVKLTMHKIVRMKDGKIFAICEQYTMAADAAGIASNIMNSEYGASMSKMVVLDMVVLTFDESMRIVSGEMINKNNNSVTLPAGLEFYGPSMVAYYMKSTGNFDYAFTTVSADRSTFNTAYINYDKVKGGKQSVIGNISYTRDKKLATDVINIDDKPTQFIALPGKPGYIGVMEYFKKLKTLNFRLEKLNL